MSIFDANCYQLLSSCFQHLFRGLVNSMLLGCQPRWSILEYTSPNWSILTPQQIARLKAWQRVPASRGYKAILRRPLFRPSNHDEELSKVGREMLHSRWHKLKRALATLVCLIANWIRASYGIEALQCHIPQATKNDSESTRVSLATLASKRSSLFSRTVSER